jgi:RimJ/RimL family protein N-acetyltransferase
MVIPIIKTQRLILREFREEDLEDYEDMCGDPEVMRYIGLGKPLSRPESWRNMAMITGHWLLRGGRNVGCRRTKNWRNDR